MHARTHTYTHTQIFCLMSIVNDDDDLVFYVPFNIINGRVIMKGSVQCSAKQSRAKICLQWDLNLALRKHAYLNILKISPPKTECFWINKSEIFHISAQNIDCGYMLELPREAVLTSTHNLCF